MLASLGMLGRYSMHLGIRISACTVYTSGNGVIPNDIGFGAPLPER